MNVSKASIRDIVEALTEKREADQLEQLRSFVRMEAELGKAREQIVLKDQEIAALRAHIDSLRGYLTSLTPASGVPAFVTPVAPAPALGYPAPATPPAYYPPAQYMPFDPFVPAPVAPIPAPAAQ